MRRAAIVYLAALVAATALFLFLPDIDLWASHTVYRTGDGFYLAGTWPVRALYRSVPWLVAAQVAGLPLLILIAWRRGRSIVGINLKTGAYVLLVLAIGPGLVVNAVLKDHWGRARPSQITEFGGAQAFTPAPLPANACDRNCSFVSGHAAVGFGLIAYSFLAADLRRRRTIAASGIAIGGLIGLARMAQGAHFLSDIVFSGLIVGGTAWLLAWALLERDLAGALWRRAVARFGAAGAGWALYALVTLIGIAVCIAYVDRPVALFFHTIDPGIAAGARVVTRLGVSTYYLVGTAAAALALWIWARAASDSAQTARLRAFAAVPLFLFLAIAASGLITDLLKVVFGRARPKLLFANETFGFDWWGTKADFWSFPSGHATTVVAIAAALYCLWPRFLPLYVGFAILISLSRAVLGAHYVSDVILAAFIAIAATAYLRHIFEGGGIVLRDAASGLPPSRAALPWRERLGFGKPRGA